MKKWLLVLGAFALTFSLAVSGIGMGEARAETTVKTNQIWYRMHFGMGVGSAALNPEMTRMFVENEVASRFPNGFNVEAAVQGQWRGTTGVIRENNFIVNIIVDNTPENEALVAQIAESYTAKFNKAKASVYIITVLPQETRHFF